MLEAPRSKLKIFAEEFNEALKLLHFLEGHHGHDRMVDGCTTTFAINAYHAKVVSLNPTDGEVYLIQHYVIKFVSDLCQASGFFRVLRFPPQIKLTAMKY